VASKRVEGQESSHSGWSNRLLISSYMFKDDFQNTYMPMNLS
jgi:hypothetical protein